MVSDNWQKKSNNTLNLLNCLLQNKTFGHDKKLLKRHIALGNSMLTELIKHEQKLDFGHATAVTKKFQAILQELKELVDTLRVRYEKYDNASFHNNAFGVLNGPLEWKKKLEKDRKRYKKIMKEFMNKIRNNEIKQDIFSQEFAEKYNDMIHLLKCFTNNETYKYDKKLIKRYLKLGNAMEKYMRNVILTRYKDVVIAK